MLGIGSGARALSRSDVAALERSVEGALIRPGDDAYNEHRQVYNGMVDHRPALILVCEGQGDVIAGVTFARRHRLLLSVKGRGHSVSGMSVCDDGLVLDVSSMNGAELNEDGMTMRCGPGLSCGEAIRSALGHDLILSLGMTSTTGVAGLTLSGGVGPLMGQYGLACDNLVSAEVITADGDLVIASSEGCRDLLWALRGGGGNFGAVTSVTLRTHPLSDIYGGMVAWPLDQAVEVMRAYRRLGRSVPDQLGIIMGLQNVPPAGPMIGGIVCYLGEARDAERALDPLFRAGRPEIDGLGRTSYLDIMAAVDKTVPYGAINHWQSGFLGQLDDSTISALVRNFRTAPSDMSAIHLWSHHGAACRVPPSATAFPHRSPQLNLHLMAVWRHPLDNARNISWARGAWRDIEGDLAPMAYAPFAGQARGRERAFFGENLTRLEHIKARYDPENLFRCTHNVLPSSGPS